MFHVTRPDGSDNVSILRMDDGKVNAIGPKFLESFPAAWREATKDGRAVVVAGNAKAFCAGLDLKTLPTLDETDLLRFTRAFSDVFRSVAVHPRPVVAAIDGPALAGGAVLALCCDFRLVSTSAKLGLTEVPVGVPFPEPILDLVRASLPPEERAPAVLAGRVREGEDCVRRGWAHALVSRDALVEEGVKLASELAGHSPLAYRAGKAGLRPGWREAFDAFGKDGAEAWVANLQHDDTVAALLRTLERMQRR